MFWEELLQTERPEGQRYWPVADADGRYAGMAGRDGVCVAQQPCTTEQHALEALKVLAETHFDSVAVVDLDGHLLGGLSADRLTAWMGAQWCFQLPGSSVWLQSAQSMMSSWIQALEEEGYRVVALATDFDPSASLFGTWIRLDQPDPTAAVETLERLGATVLGSYPPGRRHNDAQDNLDHLIHYLNL
ncbi:MAG: hypothetical protein ACKOBQ_02075 [Bacteroidota bacterium]